MYVTDITAHSGCEGTERDSLESLEKAILLGADTVEVDVRRAGDGTLRISHNALTDEEYEQKPTLRQVFERMKGTGISINCDLKEQRTLYETLDMAAEYGFGRDLMIISGCTSIEEIARDRSIGERVRVFLNVEEILKFVCLQDVMKDANGSAFFERLMSEPWYFVKGVRNEQEAKEAVIAIAKQLNIFGLNLPKWMMSDEFAARLHEEGLKFSVWTVNDREEQEKILSMRPKNMTTLNVKSALDAREQTK